MKNIIVGLIFIVAGLSGKLVLIGTDSGLALAVIGLILIIVGALKLKKAM